MGVRSTKMVRQGPQMVRLVQFFFLRLATIDKLEFTAYLQLQFPFRSYHNSPISVAYGIFPPPPCLLGLRACVYLFSISLYDRPNDIDSSIRDTNEAFDDEVDNPLLSYCFEELYGNNYGVRSFIEFEDTCNEDVEDCLADEEPIANEDLVLIESNVRANNYKKRKRGYLFIY